MTDITVKQVTDMWWEGRDLHVRYDDGTYAVYMAAHIDSMKVTCDQSNNPAENIDQGIVVVDVALEFRRP